MGPNSEVGEEPLAVVQVWETTDAAAAAAGGGGGKSWQPTTIVLLPTEARIEDDERTKGWPWSTPTIPEHSNQPAGWCRRRPSIYSWN